MRILLSVLATLFFLPVAHAQSTTTSEYRVLALINIEREERGLSRLTMDGKLTDAALEHANDMSQHGYLAHTSPNGSTMVSRLKENGVSYSAAGENIARGYTTALAVVQGWMNSPGHRANILSPKYHKVGISRVNNYWVQDFSN